MQKRRSPKFKGMDRQEHDKILHQYLSRQAIAGNSDLCPLNSPSTKANAVAAAAAAKGIRVLPILRAANSAERDTGTQHSTNTYKGTEGNFINRKAAANLSRVEAFKKKDLRGGKRARQTHLSVGKHRPRDIQEHQTVPSAFKTQYKIVSAAQISPSTQDDSIQRSISPKAKNSYAQWTISSKGNYSSGVRSNENLQPSTSIGAFMEQRVPTQKLPGFRVVENLGFENPTEEMMRRWQQQFGNKLPVFDLLDLSNEQNLYHSKKR